MKARKIVKPPGPYQSVLNSYLVEIAQLRETRPQPTPYRTIAKILKEKYGLEVSPNSIWSFDMTVFVDFFWIKVVLWLPRSHNRNHQRSG